MAAMGHRRLEPTLWETTKEYFTPKRLKCIGILLCAPVLIHALYYYCPFRKETVKNKLKSAKVCQKTDSDNCVVGLGILEVASLLLGISHVICPGPSYFRLRDFVTSLPRLCFYMKLTSSTILFFVANTFTLLGVTSHLFICYGVILTTSSLILEYRLERAYYLNITTTILSMTIAMSCSSLYIGDISLDVFILMIMFCGLILGGIFWERGGQSVGPVYAGYDLSQFQTPTDTSPYSSFYTATSPPGTSSRSSRSSSSAPSFKSVHDA